MNNSRINRDNSEHYTEHLKLEIAQHIVRIIQERKLSQLEAGVLLGVTQPEVSKLKRGPHKRFSLERLLYFLNCLDISIDIYLTAAKDKPYQKITVF